MAANAGANQMSEYPEGEDGSSAAMKSVEPLSAATRKDAAALIELFGEMIARKLFSKAWQNRDEALREIEELVCDSNQLPEEDAFMGAIQAIRHTINDKMAGVGQRAMGLLGRLGESYARVALDSSSKAKFHVDADIITQALVDKLGDNLQKVRASAEDALTAAVGHPEFGVRKVLDFLTAAAPAPGA